MAEKALLATVVIVVETIALVQVPIEAMASAVVVVDGDDTAILHILVEVGAITVASVKMTFLVAACPLLRTAMAFLGRLICIRHNTCDIGRTNGFPEASTDDKRRKVCVRVPTRNFNFLCFIFKWSFSFKITAVHNLNDFVCKMNMYEYFLANHGVLEEWTLSQKTMKMLLT